MTIPLITYINVMRVQIIYLLPSVKIKTSQMLDKELKYRIQKKMAP